MVYLTTGEVARRCQVSVGTVKNWIEAGQLEAFRTPGGHFRIKSSALQPDPQSRQPFKRKGDMGLVLRTRQDHPQHDVIAARG